MINSISSEQINLQAETSISVLVFPIGSINFAVPVEAIAKVQKYTHIFSSGLNHMGVAHIDDREVTILDLQRRLFNTTAIDAEHQKGYLILIDTPVGEQFGIPVLAMPKFLKIPVSVIRTLPEIYRRSDTLGVASHVAVISEPTLTVFMLDPEKLLIYA